MGKTVRDLMRRDPRYVRDDEFLTRARQIMRDEELRAIPVVDSRGRVLGVIDEIDALRVTTTKSNVTIGGYVTEAPLITPDMSSDEAVRGLLRTDRDVAPVVVADDRRELLGTFSVEDYFTDMSSEDLPDRPVSEVMSTDVKTVKPDDPVAQAWSNVLEFGFSGYPVVRDREVVGMVTRRDLLKTGFARIRREVGVKQGAPTTIDRIMSTPVQWVVPMASLRSAFEIMITYGIGRLPVVKNSEIVGIVDRFDIVEARLG